MNSIFYYFFFETKGHNKNLSSNVSFSVPNNNDSLKYSILSKAADVHTEVLMVGKIRY